jgi:hypothetical protein
MSPTPLIFGRDLPLEAVRQEVARSYPKMDGFAKHLSDDLQSAADNSVVAGTPRGVLPGLDHIEIDRLVPLASIHFRFS